MITLALRNFIKWKELSLALNSKNHAVLKVKLIHKTQNLGNEKWHGKENISSLRWDFKSQILLNI